MKVTQTKLGGLRVFEPKVFGDDRGSFFESYNARAFADLTGSPVSFVQDNHSSSKRSVLRGLHYQIENAQGKLVRVVQGAVLDVVVDIRRKSPTFGHWESFELSAENRLQLWVPPGFAHGYLVLSESADFLYKTTDYWYPQHERCILWNDSDLAIKWPITDPILSGKDRQGTPFAAAQVYE